MSGRGFGRSGRRAARDLGIAALLAACSVQAPAIDRKVAARPSTPASSADAPSPTPATLRSPPPRPSIADAPRMLVRPAGTMREVSGQVTIDARYAIDVGGGRLIGNNGGNVIAVGGTVISNNGGNVIANHGTGIVANNGGRLVSENGAGVGANPMGRYVLAAWRRLLAPDAPPLGTLAPAAGMGVRVQEPASGTLVDLGVDASGAPVKEILTDATGRFTIYLPADASASLLVLARAPETTDGRLEYARYTSRTAESAALDEDSSKATLFLHLLSVRSLVDLLDPARASTDQISFLAPAARQRIAAGRARQRLIAAEAGADRLPAPQRLALATRLANLIFAYVDYDATRIDRLNGFVPYDGPDETVYQALIVVMQAYRDATTVRMRELAAAGQDPDAYFRGRPYVVAVNVGRAEPYTFRKPSDVAELVVAEYLANPVRPQEEVFQAMLAVSEDIPFDPLMTSRFAAAMRGVTLAIADQIYGPDPRMYDEAAAMIRGANPDKAAP